MPLLPKEKKKLLALGERLRLARLRRKQSAEMIAERADISRTTLWQVELGNDRVSIGTYFKVMSVLGLGNDLDLLAKDDTLGRTLQDLGLVTKKRAPKK